jgi:hypothetical protein
LIVSEPLSSALKQILRLISDLPKGRDEINLLPGSLRNKAIKEVTALLRRLKQQHDLPELISELASVAKLICHDSSTYDGLKPAARQRLSNSLEGTLKELDAAAKAISPIRFPQDAFNPFAPKVVGELIANTLLVQDRQHLAASVVTKFYGAGVYALYYKGPFDAYRPISRREHPIYVGKSDPAHLHAENPKQQGTRLYRRLLDHHGNLSDIQNLKIEEFDCRFLVVHSAWVKPAEDYLIEHFHPVWNKEMKICQGFGKHGDSSDTRKNKRSPWDILHPGRGWATSEQGRTVEEVKAAIAAHFEKYPSTAPIYRG